MGDTNRSTRRRKIPGSGYLTRIRHMQARDTGVVGNSVSQCLRRSEHFAVHSDLVNSVRHSRLHRAHDSILAVEMPSDLVIIRVVCEDWEHFSGVVGDAF